MCAILVPILVFLFLLYVSKIMEANKLKSSLMSNVAEGIMQRLPQMSHDHFNFDLVTSHWFGSPRQFIRIDYSSRAASRASRIVLHAAFGWIYFSVKNSVVHVTFKVNEEYYPSAAPQFMKMAESHPIPTDDIEAIIEFIRHANVWLYDQESLRQT